MVATSVRRAGRWGAAGEADRKSHRQTTVCAGPKSCDFGFTQATTADLVPASSKKGRAPKGARPFVCPSLGPWLRVYIDIGDANRNDNVSHLPQPQLTLSDQVTTVR